MEKKPRLGRGLDALFAGPENGTAAATLIEQAQVAPAWSNVADLTRGSVALTSREGPAVSWYDRLGEAAKVAYQ